MLNQFQHNNTKQIPYICLDPASIHIVTFYDHDDPLYEFTNFSKHPITVDGIQYPTVEHYFQSQKFPGQIQAFLQAAGDSPMKALATASNWTAGWSGSDWSQWNRKKEMVMMQGLKAKIMTHPQIKDLLLATQNGCLIEDTASRNETTWGWGNDGTGANLLGKAWMRLRNELFANAGKMNLVVDADQLYAQAQLDRKNANLGILNQSLYKQLTNRYRYVNPQNEPDSELERFVASARKMIPTSGEHTIYLHNGDKITYGYDIGSVWMQGKDRNGQDIFVEYLHCNVLTENGTTVTTSAWADWALKHIVPDFEHRYSSRQESSMDVSAMRLQEIAQYCKSKFERGAKYTTYDASNNPVSYGINFQTGEFYIKGLDRFNNNIWVDVKSNGEVFEKNSLINDSGWANWALNLVKNDLNKHIADKGSTTVRRTFG